MRSDGQQLALAQLRRVARRSNGGVVIGTVGDPSRQGASMTVEVSIDCGAIEQRPGGIRLRGRERFTITVYTDFPFSMPGVQSAHRRWAGTAHVHWSRHLCLYQATSEWDPGRGLFGYLDRLWLWLTRAAVGELDPEDAPLHQPVVYGKTGDALVVPRADTPVVTDVPWIGFASLNIVSKHRVDLVGWTPLPEGGPAALAILLPQPFAWEYPTRVSELFSALERQGVVIEPIRRLLALTSHTRSRGEPMHVVLGTPMRRGHDGVTRQHIAVWELDASAADALRSTVPRPADDEELAELREDLRQKLDAWMDATTLSWCSVAENRREIVIRRDDRSPLPAAFSDKKVVLWGCGAIGGHVAEWLARAGVKELVLYDNDMVTPGVLVRQPYTDADIGVGKAYALRDRLHAILPDLEVEARYLNVIAGPLSSDDWHENADILIDATASAAVRSKLEQVRRSKPAPTTTLVGMLFGHTAERGLAVIAQPEYSGGTEDVLRQTKLTCALRDRLRGFADEFWPIEPRTEHFQPEPGCSDVTFRGSAAEVAALSAALLHAVSEDLSSSASAVARLVALPATNHAGDRDARLEVAPAVVLKDGVGPYELRVAPAALAEIRGWTRRNARAANPLAETGGVLHGRLDEVTRVAWIDTASGPPPDSIASPAEFICGTAGVVEMTAERRARSRDEIGYVGMWHTHPNMTPRASIRDLSGMLGLVAGGDVREAAMLIVGGNPGVEDLAGYVFDGDAFEQEDESGDGTIEIRVSPQPKAAPAEPSVAERDVGLALSGGGSRAVAFHLGCLRALHDRGVLSRVRVVSGVSGGALMTALWAYGPERFEEFDASVQELLRRGLQKQIAGRALLSKRLPEAALASAIGGAAAIVGRGRAPVPRWASRTDAFADVLRDALGDRRIDAPRRDAGLDTVITACDLRTGHAFRFGSHESGSWRLGTVADNAVDLATAVAASAAYPLLLPALDRKWTFVRRDGSRHNERVVLTDGGVFDNSGTSCLRPGRSASHSYNVFGVDYVIACDAGRGQLAEKLPFHMVSRLNRSFEASFRKLQDAARSTLHDDDRHAELKGFVMPYLGQQDERLPWAPPDLVRRKDVADYPTNFAAMTPDALARLTTRGEQLTRVLIERWCPSL
jgi:predicted acylesterase/phospholipase RssA